MATLLMSRAIDAIDEFAGIAAADAVFKKRRDVDQAAVLRMALYSCSCVIS